MPDTITWKGELLRILRDRWATREVFSLQEVYLAAEPLAALYPENEHVEEKIRQVLQDLRQDGDLAFEDENGHYSLIRPAEVPGDPVLREHAEELRRTLQTIRDLESQTLTSERLQSIIKGFGGQKGIYKPSGSDRALWIRQTNRGAYPDKPVDFQADGSWTYLYSPEGRGGRVDLTLDTNKGLLKCLEDKVPVGVFRQVESEGGRTRYEVLGLAYVAGMEGDHFVLRGEENDITLSPVEPVRPTFQAFEIKDQKLTHVARVLRDRKFAISIRRLYNGRCSLCNLGYRMAGRMVGLEAAHLIPVEEGGVIGDSRNGMLLCRNHHALFDQFAWTINRNLEVVVTNDPELHESAIDNHVIRAAGRVLPNIPTNEANRPAPEAIDWRMAAFDGAWKR